MEIQASRFAARVDANGAPVLLNDQDRSRWDRLLIRRGLGGLKSAERIVAEESAAAGPYQLQAAIAACHARALSPDDTDWIRIAALYEALLMIVPSPVVALNRAVAAGMAFGPEMGLRLVEDVAAEPALSVYHLLPAVRGDFLFKLGRYNEARQEFARAASLTRNIRERDLMLKRAGEAAQKSAIS
jgi:predicted RNA polymerase sigma factor